jgi:hypothetical protein
MPEPNQGQLIASAWEKVIGKEPNDNIFTSRALFYALGEEGFKQEVDGGRLIEFSLEYAENSTFKSYDELETLDTTRVNVFDCARYEWKIHAGTVVFSDLEKLRVQAKAGKFDYVEEKLQNARDSHIADINRAGYGDGSGNGGKNIEGLAKLIPDSPLTGTVGGINRANFSFWRSKAAEGTKTTNAFDDLNSAMTSVYNQCSNGGSEFAPTAALTSRTVFEGFEGTQLTYQRYNKDGKSQRGFSAGFANDALMFKGANVFYDEDCTPSDNLFFVNPKFLKLAYLKGAWMKMKSPIEPANQLSQVYRLFTMGNMGTNQSRRLGVVYDIT